MTYFEAFQGQAGRPFGELALPAVWNGRLVLLEIPPPAVIFSEPVDLANTYAVDAPEVNEPTIIDKE